MDEPVDATATTTRWAEPQDVSPETVFEGLSAGHLGILIPASHEIPSEYREFRATRTPPGITVAWMWSLYGLPGPPNWRPEIDEQRAKRHLRAILNSDAFSTGHKVAAAGYLLDLWCEEAAHAPIARAGAES